MWRKRRRLCAWKRERWRQVRAIVGRRVIGVGTAQRMFGCLALGSDHPVLRLFGSLDIGCTGLAVGFGFPVIGDKRIRQSQIGFASRRGEYVLAARCLNPVGREKSSGSPPEFSYYF